MKIQCTGIKPPYGASAAVSDVWERPLEFEQGERIIITAPSGKGKTTFLSILYGIIKPADGSISFDGVPAEKMSGGEWDIVRRTRISMLFQNLLLFEDLSGMQNIIVKNDLTDHLEPAVIREYAARLNLGKNLDKKCRTYSMGEKQRLAFLRALCQPCEWFLLDEPFSHVDGAVRREMTSILSEIVDNDGQGIILTALTADKDFPSARSLSL